MFLRSHFAAWSVPLHMDQTQNYVDSEFGWRLVTPPTKGDMSDKTSEVSQKAHKID
jgi:hypothetical protein